jgi:hypothetical protein
MKVSPRATSAGAGDGESHVSEVLRPPEREPRESGFASRSTDFLAIEEVDRRAQLALADTARIDGNLSMLLRKLEHLGAGVYAAREANADLAQQLDAALEALERTRAEDTFLRTRVRELEESLEAAERRAARDRQSFIQQEDAFLYELIDDHEMQLQRLSQQLARLTSETDADFVGEEERPTLRPPAGSVPAMDAMAPAGSESDPVPRDEASAPLGTLKLRTLRIPRPSPAAPVSDSVASDRPSGLRARSFPSGYALRSGEVADEYVDITRVKNKRDPSAPGR